MSRFLSGALLDWNFEFIPLPDIAHQSAVGDREAHRVSYIFIAHDVVYLQAIELPEYEWIGLHVMRIYIIEIVILYIGMGTHEGIGSSNRALNVWQADADILMKNNFRAAGDGVVPVGEIVVVAADTVTKVVVGNVHLTLSNIIRIDSEICGRDPDFSPVAGLGEEASAHQLSAIQPSQIVGVKQQAAEQHRRYAADLHQRCE